MSDSAGPFSGARTDGDTASLICSLAAERRSGCLLVWRDDVAAAGEVFLARGRLTAATYGTLRGLDALGAILRTLPSGQTQFVGEAVPEQRNLDLPVAGLPARLTALAGAPPVAPGRAAPGAGTPAAPGPDAAPGAVMNAADTGAESGPCPKLGFSDDPTRHYSRPTRLHVCHALDTAAPVSNEQQRDLCLTGRFSTCPRLSGAGLAPTPAAAQAGAAAQATGPGRRLTGLGAPRPRSAPPEGGRLPTPGAGDRVPPPAPLSGSQWAMGAGAQLSRRPWHEIRWQDIRWREVLSSRGARATLLSAAGLALAVVGAGSVALTGPKPSAGAEQSATGGATPVRRIGAVATPQPSPGASGVPGVAGSASTGFSGSRPASAPPAPPSTAANGDGASSAAGLDWTTLLPAGYAQWEPMPVTGAGTSGPTWSPPPGTISASGDAAAAPTGGAPPAAASRASATSALAREGDGPASLDEAAPYGRLDSLLPAPPPAEESATPANAPPDVMLASDVGPLPQPAAGGEVEPPTPQTIAPTAGITTPEGQPEAPRPSAAGGGPADQVEGGRPPSSGAERPEPAPEAHATTPAGTAEGEPRGRRRTGDAIPSLTTAAERLPSPTAEPTKAPPVEPSKTPVVEPPVDIPNMTAPKVELPAKVDPRRRSSPHPAESSNQARSDAHAQARSDAHTQARVDQYTQAQRHQHTYAEANQHTEDQPHQHAQVGAAHHSAARERQRCRRREHRRREHRRREHRRREHRRRE